jgi:tuberculosinol/isotuberculosinol synthase
VITKRHIEIYQLFFDHGLDTLLTPAFGPDLMERGEGYLQIAADGLARLATHPDFLDFYQSQKVRVRFYGDYHKFLAPTPYAYLIDLFKEVTTRTVAHDQYRLFFGLFAQDATESVAEIAIQFYQEHGCSPTRRQIVETYYGEYINSVDFFVGFGPFAAFDMPLIAIGTEDLYFTVSPSPYLDAHGLRAILYDHLYTRPGEPNYEELTAKDWAAMRQFYQLNQRVALGTGVQTANGGIWCPIGKVRLADNLAVSKD